MEKQGFKNAPQITHWAVGMEFRWMNASYRVIHTIENGQTALAVLLSCDSTDDHPYPGCQMFGRYEDRGTSILDLSVPWVGRQYRFKGIPYSDVVVLCVTGDQIGFGTIDDEPGDGFTHVWVCWAFLARYAPVPLESEAPCVGVAKHKPIEPQPWTPVARCSCEMGIGGEWSRCDVVHVLPNNTGISGLAWVTCMGSHRIMDYPLSLRPLPPEPPVEVGDYVAVQTPYGKEYIGKVISVEPEDRHFIISDGDGQRGFVWDDGRKITKLIPEQPKQ